MTLIIKNITILQVVLLDNELAMVYATSKRAEQDFAQYPPLLKQAVSLARRMQDPLVEFSQLCSHDEEILCLKYHPLQDYVPKEEFEWVLAMELINRTNEVGDYYYFYYQCLNVAKKLLSTVNE